MTVTRDVIRDAETDVGSNGDRILSICVMHEGQWRFASKKLLEVDAIFVEVVTCVVEKWTFEIEAVVKKRLPLNVPRRVIQSDSSLSCPRLCDPRYLLQISLQIAK